MSETKAWVQCGGRKDEGTCGRAACAEMDEGGRQEVVPQFFHSRKDNVLFTLSCLAT